ncbi:MAG: circadian phase modifier CpmA, partial [SAR324 cluster bacterium]|nr:circadian phase modifier CpmA [SAR324 cluster bacterium]
MTSSSSEIKLDWDRTDRIGLAEAIFCLQKSVEQIQSILEEARKNNAPLLLTRLSTEKYSDLSDKVRSDLDYDPVSQTAFFKNPFSPLKQNAPEVAVVAAG